MVLAIKHKTIFDKGYMPNLTKMHFTIFQAVRPRKGSKRRIYKLVNYNDNAVKGSWYQEKLQTILDNQYCIENDLRRRILPDDIKNYLSVGTVDQTSTTLV